MVACCRDLELLFHLWVKDWYFKNCEAHPGATRMKNLAHMFTWWPNIDKDIETCQTLPHVSGSMRFTTGLFYVSNKMAHDTIVKTACGRSRTNS